jgi:hypothetical protein
LIQKVSTCGGAIQGSFSKKKKEKGGEVTKTKKEKGVRGRPCGQKGDPKDIETIIYGFADS